MLIVNNCNIIIDIITVLITRNIRAVFGGLPEPNSACLVGVYAFLIWNNLCDLVYQTYQKLPSDSGSFRYTRSRDYQTPTRHALLGSGRC